MRTPITLDRRRHEPLHRQVYDELRRGILAGRLRPGDRLPSTRDLSAALRVSGVTVTQACPYGARYLHPKTHTADKCTFCYHRIVKGLNPACVEVCPTQARIFGDLKSKASRLVRLQRMNKIHVLKPALNTEPKVYYAQLDGEVR